MAAVGDKKHSERRHQTERPVSRMKYSQVTHEGKRLSPFLTLLLGNIELCAIENPQVTLVLNTGA
jgi:hypothetical protein